MSGFSLPLKMTGADAHRSHRQRPRAFLAGLEYKGVQHGAQRLHNVGAHERVELQVQVLLRVHLAHPVVASQ